jgi:DNA (cytosine-5)-methyltransferase 1
MSPILPCPLFFPNSPDGYPKVQPVTRLGDGSLPKMLYSFTIMRRQEPTDPPIEAIDLFCGAGGLTCGLRSSGISVLAGVDVDPGCKFPYEQNNDAPFCQRDVSSLTGRSLNELFSDGAIRLLAGCAPCQPFSTYSQGRKPHLSPKWGLLREFGRLVDESKPELVTMENVPQIAHRAPFLDFIRVLKRNSYRVAWGVLNCANYGVPQRRNRLVLMASRIGEISLPGPTHPSPKTWISVKDAIGNLARIKAGARMNGQDRLHIASQLSELNLQRIKSSTPGGTWKDWPSTLRAKCHQKPTGESFQSVYGRMSWADPAPTMTTLCFGFGNGRFGHPNQDRAISLREAAILQSFPSRYQFCSKDEAPEFRVIGRLIGNAVPPALGKAIGLAFVNHVRIEYRKKLQAEP